MTDHILKIAKKIKMCYCNKLYDDMNKYIDELKSIGVEV